MGFCGSSLTTVLRVDIDQDSPQCQRHDSFWNQVLYIAEIRCSAVDGLSSRRYVLKSEVWTLYTCRLYLTYSLWQILDKIRVKNEHHKPYILGKCVMIKTTDCPGNIVGLMIKEITLEFNSDCNAWNYEWTSHRYADKTHVIDVMALVEHKHDSSMFFLAGSYLSTCFTVVSTKRNGSARQDDACPDVDRDEEEKEEVGEGILEGRGGGMAGASPTSSGSGGGAVEDNRSSTSGDELDLCFATLEDFPDAALVRGRSSSRDKRPLEIRGEREGEGRDDSEQMQRAKRARIKHSESSRGNMESGGV